MKSVLFTMPEDRNWEAHPGINPNCPEMKEIAANQTVKVFVSNEQYSCCIAIEFPSGQRALVKKELVKPCSKCAIDSVQETMLNSVLVV